MRPLAIAALGLAPLAAWAAGCRFTLADQSGWDARRGFYLTLEDNEPCRAQRLKLTLAAAGAGQWRFAVETPAWQAGREYRVKVVLAPARQELYLDGKLLRAIDGAFTAFAPEGAPRLLAGASPEWAGRETDYLATQTYLSLSSTSGRRASLKPGRAWRPVPLRLLAPPSLESVSWAAESGETWTVEAGFRLDPRPDPAGFVPYIDRYGQSVHARWPGKIASDRDLEEAAALEARRLDEWGTSGGFDAYGGLRGTGWNLGRGFYRVARHGRRWWLITPDGNPCFYIGLNTAPALVWDRTPVSGRLSGFFAELPPRTGPWKDVWGRDSWGGTAGAEDVSFGAANLIRKFGERWREAALELTVRRVRAWGFSGLGKWASDESRLPSLPVLSRSGVPNAVERPDIFDAAVRRRFRDELARQILPRRKDPLVVGWSLGSERAEIVTIGEVEALLKLAGSPSRAALVAEALSGIYAGDPAAMGKAWGDTAAPHPPPGDLERLRRFYARAYYRFVYETVKSIDPEHLYFGFWIVPGGWENEEDWRLIAPWCDVIGFDNYSERFAADSLAALISETGKPVLAGEFSFPPDYGLARGFRGYTMRAETERAAGERYAAWVAEARENELCVGLGWFQYRDQPVSGRGPGLGPALTYGEDFAFGLVDVGDRPKWDLIERIRRTNLEAARVRWERDTAP